MKRRGSQVKLVYILMLKPRALVLAPRSSKKVYKKKNEVKTKKVASVSFLGVWFFMLLFGGLVPLFKVRYGGMREPFMSGDSYHSLHCGWGGQGESNQKNTNKATDKFIHFVFGSEKAKAFHGSADTKNSEASLTVPGDLAPAVPGPLLSSGMCTEVFQFDASSSARDISMKERQNGTHLHRNKRILNGPLVSLSRPSHNISKEQTGTNGKQESLSMNKSLSSVVVFVLVYGDGIIDPKSASRIFVVVLIDSVKHVTYSCMLPFKGCTPLVNAPEDGMFM
ncbi:hypothetical protein RDI58_010978 [Solanum bulbocastanum]|uniref:Uncharacterized protein n=1 Tax=Solanum bulbocastanum TaxID=147425 RepID=A0AAN8TUP6_SOLBU